MAHNAPEDGLGVTRDFQEMFGAEKKERGKPTFPTLEVIKVKFLICAERLSS